MIAMSSCKHAANVSMHALSTLLIHVLSDNKETSENEMLIHLPNAMSYPSRLCFCPLPSTFFSELFLAP
jgi:hypothetical protein